MSFLQRKRGTTFLNDDKANFTKCIQMTKDDFCRSSNNYFRVYLEVVSYTHILWNEDFSFYPNTRPPVNFYAELALWTVLCVERKCKKSCNYNYMKFSLIWHIFLIFKQLPHIGSFTTPASCLPEIIFKNKVIPFFYQQKFSLSNSLILTLQWHFT